MDIDKTTSRYNRLTIWIVCGLGLLVLLGMQVANNMLLLEGLIWSVVFNLVCCLLYGQAWKAMARRSPELLPKFYLAGSAFRLMAAAIVVLAMCVIMRHDIIKLKWSALLFMVFYVITLLFDAIFFAKVSKTEIDK